MAYADLLKDPRWQLKMVRNDIIRRLSGATPEEVRELAIELRENDRRRHEGVRS